MSVKLLLARQDIWPRNLTDEEIGRVEALEQSVTPSVLVFDSQKKHLLEVWYQNGKKVIL